MTRKLATAVAVCSLLLGSFGGTSLAATISVGVTVEGTGKSETLVGTSRSDNIDGNGGNDEIKGQASNDVLIGGSGQDTVNAGAGDDEVYVEGDTKRDVVVCASGDDTVYVSRNDTVDGVKVSSIVQADVNKTTCETIVVEGGGTIRAGR